MSGEVLYQDKTYCNKCGLHSNTVKVVATDEGYTSEATTKCDECGHIDYWAYGFFESGEEIVSKAKTYTRHTKLIQG